jgi:glycosyltransferase involved in cell wall biosynthesis
MSPIEPTPVIVVNHVPQAPKDLRVAVITPTKNEIENIAQFLSQLELQSYPIHLHVFVDGNSSDGTYEKLVDYATKNTMAYVLQSDAKPGAARNLAWDLITDQIDHLVFMDAGCTYEIDYIEKLVATLCFTNSKIAYTPNSINQGEIKSETSPLEVYSRFSQHDWNNWLPSSRGVAIRNPSEVYSRFPNWVTFAGDDTLFYIHLKNELRSCSVFLVDSPLVDWNPPKEEDKSSVMYSKYYFGDGETGARDWLGGAPAEYLGSYRSGKFARVNLDAKRGVSQIYVLLSLLTAGSSFGDSRITQLAMTLTKGGARVIFGASATGNINETPIWFDGDVSLFSNFMLEDEDFFREAAAYLSRHSDVTILVTEISRSFLQTVIELLRFSTKSKKAPAVEYFGVSRISLKGMYFRFVVCAYRLRISSRRKAGKIRHCVGKLKS